MDNFQKQELNDFVESLGIAYKAVFVPQSQSRNKKELPCLNWTVSFSSGENNSFQCDYMQGIGHLKNYSPKFAKHSLYYNAVLIACETGKSALLPQAKNAPDSVSCFKSRTIPKPEKLDVLYSLIMDCDAVNYRNFEDWAENFGYDIDSRSAENIYKACLNSYTEMRSVLGQKTIDKLQELFQDY